MADNRGVAYLGPGEVEVESIDFPELELKDGPGVHPDNVGRKTEHGVILKIVSTNICGSEIQASVTQIHRGRRLALGDRPTPSLGDARLPARKEKRAAECAR